MTGRKGRAPWLLSLSLSPTTIGGHDNVIGKTDDDDDEGGHL